MKRKLSSSSQHTTKDCVQPIDIMYNDIKNLNKFTINVQQYIDKGNINDICVEHRSIKYPLLNFIVYTYIEDIDIMPEEKREKYIEAIKTLIGASADTDARDSNNKGLTQYITEAFKSREKKLIDELSGMLYVLGNPEGLSKFAKKQKIKVDEAWKKYIGGRKRTKRTKRTTRKKTRKTRKRTKQTRKRTRRTRKRTKRTTRKTRKRTTRKKPLR